MVLLEILYIPGNKQKIKSAFQSGEVSTIRKNVRVGQNENSEKTLFDWFERMRMNNLPICGSIVKEEATNYAQEFQAEEFNASNSWLER